MDESYDRESEKSCNVKRKESIITCNTSHVFKKSGYSKYAKRIVSVVFRYFVIFSIPKKHALKLIRRNECTQQSNSHRRTGCIVK